MQESTAVLNVKRQIHRKIRHLTERAMGRFFICFSFLEELLHDSLCDALKIDLDKFKNPFSLLRFADLVNTWEITLNCFFEADKNIQKEISRIRGQLLNLNDHYRNPIAHGRWVDSDHEKLKAKHLNKRSFSKDTKFEEPEELIKGLDLTMELANEVIKIQKLIIQKTSTEEKVSPRSKNN